MNTERNKNAVLAYAKMWNEHKTELAEEILSESYIDHAHPELVGPKAIAATVDKTLAAMPDFHIEMSSMIAEDDLVAFREVISMTRAGTPQKLAGMSFVRLKDGKMTDRWTCYGQTSE
jgi:predicted SnoaL-like aldol condensation-catalyzing enzyme